MDSSKTVSSPCRDVRDLIDIVVVLQHVISTSWTHMMERAGSILSCASMRLGCQVPAVDGGL